MVGTDVGQYRVLDCLGRGGMGTVYHAVDVMLERDVALKVLDPQIEADAARFRAEAMVLARLAHPGIAVVHELFEHDGRLIMALELVRGETLDDILEQFGWLSPERAAALCIEALAALAHAHGAGIVHRDLKPGNLMITQAGVVKVMDFGIAKQEGSEHLTNAGFMLGTPAYMAPEQVQGRTVDARTDVYAMGVVFYRLVTGRLPFGAKTAFTMAQAHVNDEPTPIHTLRPDLPPWVSEIIARTLAKSPDERYSTALEFRDALARPLLPAMPVAASRVEATQLLPRPAIPIAARPPAWRTELVAMRGGRPLAQPSRRGGWFRVGLAAVGIAALAASPAIVVRGGDALRPAPDAAVAAAGPDVLTAQIAESGARTDGTAGVPKSQRVSEAIPSPAAPAPPQPGDAAPTKPAAPKRPATFTDIKLLTVDGTKARDRSVTLHLEDGAIRAVAEEFATPAATMPARAVVKATFVRARDPVWDSALAGPSGPINVPGVFGRSRRWLTVQGRNAFVILRLDGADWEDVLTAFETHVGVRVTRPEPPDR